MLFYILINIRIFLQVGVTSPVRTATCLGGDHSECVRPAARHTVTCAAYVFKHTCQTPL